MSNTEQKTKPASKRKLEKQREEGSIANGQALAGLMGTASAIGVIAGAFAMGIAVLGGGFDTMIRLIELPFNEAMAQGGQHVQRNTAIVAAPIVGAAAGTTALVALLYNRGPVFSIKAIAPKLERVSPMSGLKRIYGSRGMAEAAQAFTRLGIWSALVGAASFVFLPPLLQSPFCQLSCQVDHVTTLSLIIGALAVGALTVSAGLDMILQRALFLKEQKMTESEVKREQKDQNGSKEVRGERNRLKQEMSSTEEHAGAAKSNMCFFVAEHAVGICYHPEQAPLPRVAVTASGQAEAKALRDKIRKMGFPEQQNAKIVAACIKTAPGQAVNSKIYSELARAMSEMFGQNPEG